MWTYRFWTTFWAITSTLVVALAMVNHGHADRPERPQIGLLAEAFPAEYLDTPIVQNIYYHGLFGLGSHIRTSNIIIIGSSHPELGFSALRLSSATGRSVFNLGVSSGSVSFGLDVLKKNGSVGKLLVADAFTIDSGLTGFERDAERNDIFSAYAAALRIWGELAFDWSLDPLMPRVYLRGPGLAVGRYLASVVLMNDWQHGGALSIWFPEVGEVYAGDRPTPWFIRQRGNDYFDVAKESTKAGYDWNFPAGRLPISEEIMTKARSIRSTLVITMVPYTVINGRLRAAYESVARTIAPQGDLPADRSVDFLPISPNGLLSYDRTHLILPSATIATNRLLGALRERGLVQ